MKRDGWIVIPNWDKFQHYRDRRPLWVKLYVDLLDRDAWTSLRHSDQGILVNLWALYALVDGQLTVRTAANRIGFDSRTPHLERLRDAGFIDILASKPLAIRYQVSSLETETETEPPKSPTVEKSKAGAEEAHDRLLMDAAEFAHTFNGGGSDVFDEGLEQLERRHRRRLSVSERMKLWDTAFGGKP